MPKVEDFTPKARLILAHASEEAVRLRTPYIGTWLLLDGYSRVASSFSLDRLGLDPDRIRQEIEPYIERRGESVVTDTRLTSSAKIAIGCSVGEAVRQGEKLVNTDHMMLGMLAEGKGVAAGILQRLGVRIDTAREVIAQVTPLRYSQVDRIQAFLIDPASDRTQVGILQARLSELADRFLPPLGESAQ